MEDLKGLRALLVVLAATFLVGVLLLAGIDVASATPHALSLVLAGGLLLQGLSLFFLARKREAPAYWCALLAMLPSVFGVGGYLLAFNGVSLAAAAFGFWLAELVHLPMSGALALLLLASGTLVASLRRRHGFGSEALLASGLLSVLLVPAIFTWQQEAWFAGANPYLLHTLLPTELVLLLIASLLQLVAAALLKGEGFELRNRFLPVFAFVVLLVASFHLWLVLVSQEQESIRREAEATVERLSESLTEHMRVRTEALERMASRIADAEMERAAWARDARAYLQDFESLSAIGWITPDGMVRWGMNRDDMQYLEGEPYAVDETRRELLRVAEQTGMNAFTPPTALRAGGYGQLVAIPMRNEDKYIGSLVVGLRFSQLLERQVAHVAADFAVVVETHGVEIYSRIRDQVQHPLADTARASVNFDYLGWRITLWPESRFFDRNFLWLPGFLLTLGIIAALLFAISLYQLEMQRRRSASLRSSEERYRLVAEQTGAVVYDYHVASGRIEWAGAIRDVMRESPRELSQVDIEEWEGRLHPDDAARAIALLGEAEKKVSPYVCEYRFRRGDGSYVRVEDRGVFLPGAGGLAERMLGKISDVTERYEFEQKLKHLAHFDQQTGLRNRVWFMEDALMQVEADHGTGKTNWFVFCDVDRFRSVNETLGHAVGDLLLEAVARRLESVVRERGVLARLGGDEFGVLLDGDKLDRREVQAFCSALMDAFGAPFEVASHSLFVTVSVGLACHPQDGADAQAVIRAAETAMFRAKHRGRNTWAFYEASMSAGALENLAIANALRIALDRNEFHLVFQPRISLSSGRITGMEALLRWRNNELGLVSPATFIPVAEETGLIGPIGWYVVDAAAAAAHRIGSERMAGRRIAINVSARQLVYGDFVRDLVQRVENAGASPHWFEIELTESLVMEDPQRARQLFVELHAAGFLISIDDFGTGYSSLSYLKHFPVDHLKIDRTFVMGLPDSTDDGAIVSTIVSMGKGLGLRLIAEGIETEAQAQFLREAGCEEAQGYLFARPMPLDELISRLD